ncbi:MAG: sarcosine oxidase subunit gamma [Rhodobacterales bacterium]|nr:sarcosine oxidase subunit gamma [Rhodobacterales bacterium]
MPDPVTPLGHETFDGFARIREIGPLGMITLRAAPDRPELAAALAAAGGLPVPGLRRIARAGDRAVAWMGPDEFLLILPHAQVPATLATLAAALGAVPHLAADVSDARAVFAIEGARADQVLAKLTPADLEALGPDEMRRTRLAQVACALWRQDDGFRLVAFRSVARYVMDLLIHAAQPGSELR